MVDAIFSRLLSKRIFVPVQFAHLLEQMKQARFEYSFSNKRAMKMNATMKNVSKIAAAATFGAYDPVSGRNVSASGAVTVGCINADKLA
jgi:hypothetical protein